jgi:hypothetical protein
LLKTVPYEGEQKLFPPLQKMARTEQQCNKETKKNIAPSCPLMQINAVSFNHDRETRKEHNLHRHRIPRNTKTKARREKSSAQEINCHTV